LSNLPEEDLEEETSDTFGMLRSLGIARGDGPEYSGSVLTKKS